MHKRKIPLDEHLTLSKIKVDIPTRNIIDEILLTVKATYTNSNTTTDATLTDEQLAGAITEIRVVSDGSNTHYALSLKDILTINYYDTAGKVPSLDASNTVPASDTLEKIFLVRLDGGDIVAALKQALAISIQTNTTVSTDVSLTDLDITITINEAVIESVEELTDMYGPQLEFLVEPKITAIETNVSSNTSFTGLIEVPTGTAIKRNFYIAKNSSGARSDSVIDEYGITDKNATVVFKQHQLTGQHDDQQEYNLPATLKGITVLDIADEMEGDNEFLNPEVGMKGWNFVKGDYFDAFKLTASGTIRVIRHELICAPALQMYLDGLIDDDALPEDFTFDVE